MAPPEPISVKNALYEQCFAAARISSQFFNGIKNVHDELCIDSLPERFCEGNE
jgi:hypothetical protein